MTDLRRARHLTLAVLVAACTSTAPQQQRSDAELAALAPLKHRYAGLVMGLDIRPQTTLVVSLDLQSYIETDDDTIAAMKRDALARWRAVWIGEHPREHATVRVRFIDFIGRTVAAETAHV
ncbi:MAG: hypothetical protein JOZ77_09310 [Candidatus Eremiobacteraeota bacterium]|nr:hypothetical protein [Candidatus Eremiobacteraeota bacterium]